MLGHWSHPHFSFQRGDVTDAAAVVTAVDGVDAVVHLAAIVGDPACARQPDLARATNLGGTENVLAAAQQAGAQRFVFASTCSNYGRMADPTVPVHEESELRPVSLYAETKVASEHLVMGAERVAGTALRFSTVYGVSPRMRFDLTVNEFAMEAVCNGKLVVFGQQFWRPYIHVRDAAAAIMAVLAADVTAVKGRVFNVGADQENYRKKDIVDLTLAVRPETEVEYVHKNEDPRDYRVAFGRIREALNFTTKFSVADGIEEVARLISVGAVTDPKAPHFKN